MSNKTRPATHTHAMAGGRRLSAEDSLSNPYKGTTTPLNLYTFIYVHVHPREWF